MVWAIDLDDGTLLNALGSVSSRPKESLLKDLPSVIPDFDSPWPDSDAESEL